MKIRRGLSYRGGTSCNSMSWTHFSCRVGTSWRFCSCRGVLDHVVHARSVVENINVCRGEHICRNSMSWVTPGMSWGTGLSWKYVVHNIRFLGDVVGDQIVCRGKQGCRECMSWVTG